MFIACPESIRTLIRNTGIFRQIRHTAYTVGIGFLAILMAEMSGLVTAAANTLSSDGVPPASKEYYFSRYNPLLHQGDICIKSCSLSSSRSTHFPRTTIFITQSPMASSYLPGDFTINCLDGILIYLPHRSHPFMARKRDNHLVDSTAFPGCCPGFAFHCILSIFPKIKPNITLIYVYLVSSTTSKYN